MPPKKVFVSYPSESLKDVQEIVGQLKERGIDVWFAQDKRSLAPNLPNFIREGIQESFCCLFILNKHSAQSKWCHAEVGAFWGTDRPIVVLMIPPEADPRDMPPYLPIIQHSDDFERVVETIEDFKKNPSDPLIRSGLENAFKIPTDNPARDTRIFRLIDEEMATGRKKFRLSASSGFSYLHPMGRVFREGLATLLQDNLVTMQVVLESPFSEFALTRAIANGKTHHQWEDKYGPIPAQLVDLLKYHPSIEIRVTDAAVNCSLFFTSQSVYYDPYLWARHDAAIATENNFWVFEFQPIPSYMTNAIKYDCYKLLEKHFEFLWDHSKPLEEILCSPPDGEGVPRGVEFYRRYEEEEDKRENAPNRYLNRYNEMTRKFRRDMRSHLNSSG